MLGSNYKLSLTPIEDGNHKEESSVQRFTSAAIVSFLLIVSPQLLSQTKNSKWQVGTIMAVAEHQTDGENSHVRKYDVTVRVDKTLYVVLYTPPDGTDTITYRAGLDLLVSVKPKTIAFNNLLGRKMEVPILSRKPTSPST
jgi:hypothetical protein